MGNSDSWASEQVNETQIVQATKSVVFRAQFRREHGHAEILRQQLAQEGYALSHSNWQYSKFTEEEIEYTRTTIQPFLDADDFRTSVECLFWRCCGKIARFQAAWTRRLGRPSPRHVRRGKIWAVAYIVCRSSENSRAKPPRRKERRLCVIVLHANANSLTTKNR